MDQELKEAVAQALYMASRPSANDPFRDHPESWRRLVKYYPEHAAYWRMMAEVAFEAMGVKELR
jgi:hypothetical protein